MGEFEFGLGSISWEFSPAAVGVAAAGICCALLLYEQELRYSEGAACCAIETHTRPLKYHTQTKPES